MQHKQPVIVKSRTADEKFPTFEVKASSIAPWLGLQTQQSPEPCNMQQTFPPAQMETRNPHGPPPTKSSHDTGSPSSYISKSIMASRGPHGQSHQPLHPSTPAA